VRKEGLQQQKTLDHSTTRPGHGSHREDRALKVRRSRVIFSLAIVVMAIVALGVRGFSLARSLDLGAPYTNSKIGIRLVVPPDWSTRESTDFPDEILDISPDDDSVKSTLWVDRFPDMKAVDFTTSTDPGDDASLFIYYSRGIDLQGSGKISYKLISRRQVKKNGVTWGATVFTMEYNKTFSYVKVYTTDMPHGRGAFALALMAPVDSATATPARGDLGRLELVFNSLEFVK